MKYSPTFEGLSPVWIRTGDDAVKDPDEKVPGQDEGDERGGEEDDNPKWNWRRFNLLKCWEGVTSRTWVYSACMQLLF